MQVDGARKVPFSSVFSKPRSRLFFNREFTAKDKGYVAYMTLVHLGALAAPFFFRCVQLAAGVGAATVWWWCWW